LAYGSSLQQINMQWRSARTLNSAHYSTTHLIPPLPSCHTVSLFLAAMHLTLPNNPYGWSVLLLLSCRLGNTASNKCSVPFAVTNAALSTP
jgi:hypothetical protein